MPIRRETRLRLRRRLGATLVFAVVAMSSLITSADDARAANGDHLWSKRFGDTDYQEGLSVAVDGAGNVLLTGWFGGTADFGGGPLTSAGDMDIFVAKFDSSGNHLWSKRFGDASFQAGRSVAVDGAGNVLLAGFFSGAADFGGGPLTSTSAGDPDIFVAKLDGSGNHLWSKRFGDMSTQAGESVAVDGAGNVLLTGGFDGTADFGGGPLTGNGSFDIFVAKFDSNGNHLWSKRFGDGDGQFGESVAVDGTGDVLLTGSFLGTADFGGGPLAGVGDPDIFVAKFDGSGNHLWSKRFGDVGGQIGESVAVDGTGNVLLTGGFVVTADFGGGPLTSAGDADIFVAKFDSSGNHLWSKRFGDASGQVGRSVAVDAAGNVLLTGEFYGAADFGGGPLTSAGNTDIFVAMLDGSGNHLWSQRFGGAGSQLGESVAVDGARNVLLTGGLYATADFGGGSLTSAGNADIFVAKLGMDTDGDGCTDGSELGPNQLLGGQRSPLHFWDFFDVTGDQAIDLSDTLDILGYFGDAGTSPAGNLRDRDNMLSPQPWQTYEVNDGVDLTDALVNLQSFGHDCCSAQHPQDDLRHGRARDDEEQAVDARPHPGEVALERAQALGHDGFSRSESQRRSERHLTPWAICVTSASTQVHGAQAKGASWCQCERLRASPPASPSW